MSVYGAAYVVCDIGCSGVSSVVKTVVMSESVSSRSESGSGQSWGPA